MAFYSTQPNGSPVMIEGHALYPSEHGWLVESGKFVSFWSTWNPDGTVDLVLTTGIFVRSNKVYTESEAIAFLSDAKHLSHIRNAGVVPDGFWQPTVGQ